MKIRVIVALLAVLLTVEIAPGPPDLVAEAVAQSRGQGQGGGRSAKRSSNTNRNSSARSGSTSRQSQPSASNRSGRQSPSGAAIQPSRSGQGTPQNRAGASPGRGQGGRGDLSNRAGTPGARNSVGRRTATRRNPTASHRRSRSRRVHRSRRWRRGGWGHHRYWRHRGFYGGFWPGLFIIRTAAFITIANSSTTHVHYSVTYYHYNPWYRPLLYDGEEGHVLTTAPVGWQTDQLPDGSEQVTVDGTIFHYHEGAFYQPSQGAGYEVVEAPVGAEVSSIPDDAQAHDEGELPLYQFDKIFFAQDTNDAGQTIYRVEPPPPEEELDAIPAGSPSFVADAETYHYVNYSLYVQYEEDGQTGYVNGEPEVGAQVDELPEGATTIEDGGVTYYQFDMVFFEEVEDGTGGTFYQVVDAPGEDDAVELQN